MLPTCDKVKCPETPWQHHCLQRRTRAPTWASGSGSPTLPSVRSSHTEPSGGG